MNVTLEAPAVVRSPATRVKRLARPTILIVDDDESFGRVVDQILRMADYRTALATGGFEALKSAKRMRHLDLLVTDVRMPAMQGDELARRLLIEKPKLKVLYLTGYSDSLFEERAALWENEAYLSKPCSARSLLDAVATLLRGGGETSARH